MPSFSVSLSGLDANSAALSAISNNLANLNTVGYKTSDTEFHDLFYQNLAVSGDGSPVQVGVGSGVSSMVTQFTQGSTENNGVSSNVAIEGDGFFLISKNGETQFTRAGDFSTDAAGELITPEGAKVLGYPAN